MTGRARTVSSSVEVAATPEHVYALVSDPTQYPRWSPENTGATGAGPLPVGAAFDGTNVRGRFRWVTRSVVTAAEPGAAFAFQVRWIGIGSPRLRAANASWSYRLEPAEGGTRVTETWTDDRPWPDPPARIFDRIATGTSFAAFQERNLRRSLQRLRVVAEDETPAGRTP